MTPLSPTPSHLSFTRTRALSVFIFLFRVGVFCAFLYIYPFGWLSVCVVCCSVTPFP